MRGASSMVKKVRMAIVTMVTRVDTAAAPTEKAVAGLSTLVICEVILVEPSDRYFCRCSRNTSRPSGPWPFLASRTSVGDLLAEVDRGRHQRLGEQVHQPDERQDADQEDEQGGTAMAQPAAAQEARGRRQEEREEEGDDRVDDDVAQDPQAEDRAAALRSSSRMTVATDTTMVPSGMPRRSALPENLERHVSWAFGGMAPSLAAAEPERRFLGYGCHVQA